MKTTSNKTELLLPWCKNCDLTRNICDNMSRYSPLAVMSRCAIASALYLTNARDTVYDYRFTRPDLDLFAEAVETLADTAKTLDGLSCEMDECAPVNKVLLANV